MPLITGRIPCLCPSHSLRDANSGKNACATCPYPNSSKRTGGSNANKEYVLIFTLHYYCLPPGTIYFPGSAWRTKINASAITSTMKTRAKIVVAFRCKPPLDTFLLSVGEVCEVPILGGVFCGIGG